MQRSKKATTLTDEQCASLISKTMEPRRVSIYSAKMQRKHRKLFYRTEREHTTYLPIACLLSIMAGLRHYLVCHLQWKEVIFPTKLNPTEESAHDLAYWGFLRINRSKMKYWKTDNRGNTFDIPIHPILLKALWRQKKADASEDCYVLTNTLIPIENFHNTYQNCYKSAFKDEIEKGEMPKTLRFHDLRATFGQFAKNAVSWAAYQSFMDHALGNTTEQRYGDITDETKVKEMSKICLPMIDKVVG